MHTIQQRARGYRIELDGPLSLLQGSSRYGLRMAVFLDLSVLWFVRKLSAADVVERANMLMV
jgi:predicted nuclease of restriction endonuclease-like RecB superfamily